MNSSNNSNRANSIENIFAGHQKALMNFQQQHKGKKHASKRELEQALAILLVELASCDQNFDTNEYNIIISGLKRIFGTERNQVTALINQANAMIASMRGSSGYGVLLRDNLSIPQRQNILEIVEEIISADGRVDGFEIYVRNKIAELLGLPKPEPVAVGS